MVKVPVLSEQITDVQPKVSTDGRLRTIEFFFAIRRVPSAKQVVITAGRPSGIAATAKATAIFERKKYQKKLILLCHLRAGQQKFENNLAIFNKINHHTLK